MRTPLVAALASIILISTLSCISATNIQSQRFGKLPSAFGISNATSVDNDTWYSGKGAKPDTYVKYAIHDFETNNNQTFIMTIYFQQYNATGKYWIAPVYVFDSPSKNGGNNVTIESNRHIIKGRFLLRDADMSVLDEPIIPPQLSQYKGAYENSLTSLNGFTSKYDPRSLSAPSWGRIGAIQGLEVRLENGTEKVTVPAGTFNTTLIMWHHSLDNKIWVNKDFPYPIKAKTYLDLIHPPYPIWYEFELLEYGKGKPTLSTITSDNGSTIVIPEFSTGALLPILATITAVTILLSKKKAKSVF